MDVNALIAYAASFDPGFPARVQAATPEEVAELEALSGVPFPNCYRAYLLRMGRDAGGLDLVPEGSARVSDVIAASEGGPGFGSGPGPNLVPPGCLLIGVGDALGEDVVLKPGPDGAKVYLAHDGRLKSLYADSLEALLYRLAFIKYRLNAFASSAWYEGRELPRQLGDVRAIASELGFRVEWFSDSVEVCASHAEAAVYAAQFEAGPLAMTVSAVVPATVERVAAVFADRLGLVRNG